MPRRLSRPSPLTAVTAGATPAERFTSFPAPLTFGRRGLGRLALGGALASLTGGITFLSSLHPALADSATELGTVSRLKKLAGATRGADSRGLDIGDKVYRNDLLWTRSGGQLRIDLKDGSNLSLGENAEVTLEDSMLSGSTSGFLRIISGAFRFASGGGEKAATPPRIETPFAVLSLRGTEVYGVKFGKAWGFFVSSGQVEVRNDTGAVLLNAGDGTEVEARNGPLEPVKKWGAPKIAKTKAQFRF